MALPTAAVSSSKKAGAGKASTSRPLRPSSIGFAATGLAPPTSTSLSNQSGIARFTHVVSPQYGDNFGNGSLTHLPAHRDALAKEGCQFVEHEVRTVTYPELIAEAGISRLDLFVLDVEGHEAQVFESMRQGALLPSVLCVEHGHFGVEKMREMLAGLPFRFDSSLHVNSYYVNTLNPPSKPGALARLWDRVRGD